MTRQVRTRIRYDGPALADHEMDVQDLAPALLAIAEIVQIANRKFNGDAATIRVLVDADVEQRCFQLDLSLIQSVADQTAALLGTTTAIATAKEIGEWVGLIKGTGLGLFQVLRLICGRRDGSKPAVTFVTGDQAGTTIINIAGDVHSLTVPTPTAKLLVDKDVSRNVRAVLKPLQQEGYEELTFLADDVEVARIDKGEAVEIVEYAPLDLSTPPTESVSHIRGAVRIKSPQYEGSAKWSLLWQGRAIDAEMADNAVSWVEDFQQNRVAAPPNTTLDVSMSETVKLDDKGLAIGRPSYVVHEVHSVTPPPAQTSWPF